MPKGAGAVRVPGATRAVRFEAGTRRTTSAVGATRVALATPWAEQPAFEQSPHPSVQPTLQQSSTRALAALAISSPACVSPATASTSRSARIQDTRHTRSSAPVEGRRSVWAGTGLHIEPRI